MFDELKSAALISLQKVEQVTDFEIDGLTDLRVAHDKVANTGMFCQFKKCNYLLWYWETKYAE